MHEGEGQELRRDMAISHVEFRRSLAAAFDRFDHAGAEIRLWYAGKQVIIHLGPEGERRIASLSLPLTPVTFRFPGHGPGDVRRFLEYFERRFQRGGG